MAEESLKEILLNVKPGDYDKIMGHRITQKDISDFNNLYSEFASLEKDYQRMILGRKEASLELVKRLDLLEQMSRLIERGMKSQKYYYENVSSSSISFGEEDSYKVLEVLKRLASGDSLQYEVKTITFPAFDSSERHGYRTTSEYTGKITILGEKESISKLDSSRKLPFLNQEMLVNIYQQGFSMILIGNDEYYTERLNLQNKQTIGSYHPLVFYLQNDELANATSSLMSFVEENGTDLSQIEVDDLVKLLKDKYQKSQKRKKLV